MLRVGRKRRVRSGAVLLETMIALAILSTAGVAIVGFAGESIRSVTRTRAAEREIRQASAFLDAVALWSRDDLDRHLGSRTEGSWRLLIGRPKPTLYTVVLSDSATGRELLHTALFRAAVVSTESNVQR